MKKRILAAILAAVMVMALVPAVSAADYGGTLQSPDGDDVYLTWTIENDVLTISGNGSMPDFPGSSDKPWNRNTTVETSFSRIVIEPGVTSIGANAFSWLDITLNSVSIPNTVQRIGSGAFYHCTRLTEVTIPESVTVIEGSAFASCNRLQTVSLPPTLKTIGDSAFEGCFGLSDITLPSGLTEIGSLAFDRCALKSIVIPGSVKTVGASAFTNCDSLTDVTLQRGVQTIGDLAFRYCDGLTSITLPRTLTEIRSYAFDGCGQLTALKLPEGLKTIAECSFRDCSGLTEVTLPYSVSHVGREAFAGCGGLRSVTVLNPNCVLPDGAGQIGTVGTATISGYTGSTARDYALKCGYLFESLGENRFNFTDVPVDSYFEIPVIWAVQTGVTLGTGGGNFTPQKQCTQAEIITFLWRAAGEPEPAAAVTGTEFYAKAVQWAKEKGIIDGSFELFKNCTRKTAVTYMWKYAGSPTDAPAAGFPDVPAGSDFARAVAWALQKGVTEGTDQGVFLPETVCDRGQIVTFLYRAFG